MEGTLRSKCWTTSPTVLGDLELVTQPLCVWMWYSEAIPMPWA